MNKLKVGDKVIIYDTCNVFKGIVKSIAAGEYINIVDTRFNSEWNVGPFHYKQCRKLVKKGKK